MASTQNLATSTLKQYLSHLRYFQELGYIPSVSFDGYTRFFTGLNNIKGKPTAINYLSPTVLLAIFNNPTPTKIEAAILFQAVTGLRAGHLCVITAEQLPNQQYMLVPPYKHRKTLTLLPLAHVHPTILKNFLKYSTNPSLPVLGMAPATYKSAFKKTMQAYGISRTTHTARHAFATIHYFLKSPVDRIGHYLLHQQPQQTTVAYIHDLSAAEGLTVMNNRHFFLSLKPV